jgi:catechol 2,3-dioxygenase-like lactoylglutathione lyase family enzyme
MRVTGIGWVGVLTDDYEETLHFFSEILGLSLEYRNEDKVHAHFRLPSGQLLEVFGPSNRQR